MEFILLKSQEQKTYSGESEEFKYNVEEIINEGERVVATMHVSKKKPDGSEDYYGHIQLRDRRTTTSFPEDADVSIHYSAFYDFLNPIV